MENLKVTPLSCLPFLFFHFYNFSILFSKIVFLFLFQICFIASIGIRVSLYSVVGAPWRCGVLTIEGGIGLGHLLGREHDSTPQSGVEAPRLVKGASPD